MNGLPDHIFCQNYSLEDEWGGGGHWSFSFAVLIVRTQKLNEEERISSVEMRNLLSEQTDFQNFRVR